jgi:hypothetical protein
MRCRDQSLSDYALLHLCHVGILQVVLLALGA